MLSVGGHTCLPVANNSYNAAYLYNTCLKSMPCAHILNLSGSLALLRQVDLIWAAERSERPNPHSPLPAGFWATVGDIWSGI